jgi:hypothetical protein
MTIASPVTYILRLTQPKLGDKLYRKRPLATQSRPLNHCSNIAAAPVFAKSGMYSYSYQDQTIAQQVIWQ